MNCPRCNQQRTRLFLLPCYSCHVLCEECKNSLPELFGLLRDRNDGKKCWLFGENCPHRTHFVCSKCEPSKNVFHIPRDGLRSVQDLSTEDLVNARRTILRNLMEAKLQKLREICRGNVVTLQTLKNELNEKTKNCRVSKIAGSSVGIGGGALFIVGAILAPFTFGASTPLMIAGGVAAGVGGGVAGGTGIVELVINKDTAKETEKLLKKVQERYCKLIDYANEYRIVDSFGHLGPEIARGGFPVVSNIGLGVFRLVMLAGATGRAAFTISAATARVGTIVLHSLGSVLAAVAVVVDIVTIVANGKELHRGDPAKFSAQIDKVIVEVNNMEAITMEDLLQMHLE